MTCKAKRIAPFFDLGDFITIIRDEYDGVGFGFSIEEPNEVALAFEKDQILAGIIDDVNYLMTSPLEGLPTVTRKNNSVSNLNYIHYEFLIDEARKEELLADRARLLKCIVREMDTDYYRCIMFLKDGQINLLMNSASTEGSCFTEEKANKLLNNI